jgi:hypothetical protein
MVVVVVVVVVAVVVVVVGMACWLVGVSAFVVGVLAFRYLRVVGQLALSMKPALFFVRFFWSQASLLMTSLLFE